MQTLLANLGVYWCFFFKFRFSVTNILIMAQNCDHISEVKI